MEILGSFNRQDIGKFRSLESVRLCKQAQGTFASFEAEKERFLKHDNQDGVDFNSEIGVVLIDGHTRNTDSMGISTTSGFLDKKSGIFQASERVDRSGTRYGPPSTTVVEFDESVDGDKKIWESSSTSQKHGSNTSKSIERIEEMLSTGVVTVFKPETVTFSETV